MRSQAGVLPLPPDGQRELIIRHDDKCGFFVRVDHNGNHLGRRKSIFYQVRLVLVPVDYIYLFPIQLAYNRIDTGSVDADAGAYRVHIRIVAPDSNLCTGTGLAGNGFNFDDALADFRNLFLKQSLDEFRMCAGNQNLGTFGCVPDLQNINLHPLVLL